jgi:hypothetical protein
MQKIFSCCSIAEAGKWSGILSGMVLRPLNKKPAQLALKQVLYSLAVFIKRPQAELKSALYTIYLALVPSKLRV